MSKMQTASTRSDSSVVEDCLMNPLSYCDSVERMCQNHVIDGLVLGQAMDSLACQRIASSVALPESDGFVSSYPQTGDYSRFLDCVPLSAGSINAVTNGKFSWNENYQEKIVATSVPFLCPSECTTDDASGVVNSSFEFTNCGYESMPFEMSTGRSFDKCVIPPEVVGMGVGKTGVQPVPIEWMIDEHCGLNCDSPGSSRFSNEFMLCRNSTREQCSEISSSGSIFVQAMQEILAEIAFYTLKSTGIESSICDSGKGHQAFPFPDSNTNAFQDNREVEAKEKHLLALLQLVDDRYNQCLHEIHTVSSAFHAVTELDPNLHARFALPTVSSMYKNLRERISSHILPLGVKGGLREDKSLETHYVEKQWALQQLSKRDHHLWRPQRGLPERSVCVLRAWMFQNFLHPYPKDADKHLLALKSGLTRNQVSNWFINARVRLWKPMIEEMYAELNRRKSRN